MAGRHPLIICCTSCNFSFFLQTSSDTPDGVALLPVAVLSGLSNASLSEARHPLIICCTSCNFSFFFYRLRLIRAAKSVLSALYLIRKSLKSHLSRQLIFRFPTVRHVKKDERNFRSPLYTLLPNGSYSIKPSISPFSTLSP